MNTSQTLRISWTCSSWCFLPSTRVNHNFSPPFERICFTSWWLQRFFIFTPYLGKWSNLTHIFQMGWNHQLVYFFQALFQMRCHWKGLTKGHVFGWNSSSNMENRRGPLNRRIKRYSILQQLNFGDSSDVLWGSPTSAPTSSVLWTTNTSTSLLRRVSRP